MYQVFIQIGMTQIACVKGKTYKLGNCDQINCDQISS